VSELQFEKKSSAELERRLAELLRGDCPVLVGPWLAEIGPELLYWIPFLRWIVERFEVDPARLTAISRGGVASWYAGIAGSYRDIFETMGVDRYRKLNDVRWAGQGGMKQGRFTYWDRRVLKQVAGWDGHSPVLHPAFMYRFFRRWWKNGLSLEHVLSHLSLRALDAPALPDSLRAQLPEEYAVAAFYFRPSFPDTPAHRALVRDAIAVVGEQLPVVSLDAEIKADEHESPELEASDRLLTPLAGAPAETNLALQSAVAARARLWIGTYGGRTHIATVYGVPCISFTSDRGSFLASYLDVLRRLSAITSAPYTVLETGDLPALRALVPRRVAAA
jgi:hypothetical protein